MALLSSELTRIKYELGFPGLSTNAEPYIGIVAAFDQVVAPYLLSGAITTSSTAVTAQTTLTPVAITLASATGVHEGDRLIIDVESRQESAVIQTLSGAVATVSLTLDHSGTYPVTVEGSESIVRDILRKLVVIGRQIEESYSFAGIKKADEVEFFPSKGSGGSTAAIDLMAAREYQRAELSRVLFGVGGLNGHYAGGTGGGSGGAMAVY